MEDTSYIIKTKIGDKYFIVNRNKSMVDSEVKPTKAISWWGLDDKKFKAYVLSDIEILEEVPYDNSDHRHQKILNSIKNEWRNRLGEEVETTNMSDEPVHQTILEKKRRISDAYKVVEQKYDLIREMDDSDVKRIAIDLIVNKYHIKYKGYERWRIYKQRDSFPSEGHLIFYLFKRGEITEMGKRCYGLWMNNKDRWISLEACIVDIITNRYTWNGLFFSKK